MKVSIQVILIFSFLSIFSYSQQKDDTVLATVGTHFITLKDFNTRYTNYLFSTGVKDNLVVRKAILDNMINEILLYYYDDNENILKDPSFLQELEQTRVQLILAYLKEEEIYSKINVTEQEIRQAFSRVNEEIAARHLFAKTEEEANNLYELAKIGVDFKVLAKQVFSDSVLQNNGGYLGYFTWGDMDPAFEDAAYSMKVGEISPPVKTEYGYSIIKLEDRITNPLLTESEFQRKKAHLEEVVKMRKKEPAEKAYIESIFDETKLSFNDEILQNILNNINSDKLSDQENFVNHSNQCAKYIDRVFTKNEIEKRVSELPVYQRKRIKSLEYLKAAIEGILLRDTLYNIAVSKGFDTTKVVLDKIQKYNENILLRYKKQDIISKAQLPDSVLFKYYKDNINLFSTEPELNLQEILVDDQQLADSLINLINIGEDFGELAKKFSLRSWSAKNNGIIGYSPLSKFGNYKNLFWDSGVGEVIGPIKIENIFGIFKVLGKEESKPLDYQNVKAEVIKGSQLEHQKEIMENYLGKIRNTVGFKVNENILKSYIPVE